jgi:uncharacterized membrane protein YozB (DUF420 family)
VKEAACWFNSFLATQLPNLMDIISILPHLQATLNLTAVGLMTTAYDSIRTQHKAAHMACMVAALVVSTLFLLAYLTYHLQVGNVKFAGEGLIRPIYFTILFSHVLLAALIVPLIVMTVSYAITGQFTKHRRLGRWTLPLWLYVSITGIIVYGLAFHLYPPLS